jgi:hypothetical protein
MGHAGPIAGASASLAPAIDVARAGTPFNDIVAVGDTLLLVVAEPVRFADELLATFTVGYRLDDAVARELKLVTHLDVSFLCRDGDVCASSLSTSMRRALSDALAASPQAMGESNGAPALRDLDGAAYVGRSPSSSPSPSRSCSAGVSHGRCATSRAWPTKSRAATGRAVCRWMATPRPARWPRRSTT